MRTRTGKYNGYSVFVARGQLLNIIRNNTVSDIITAELQAILTTLDGSYELTRFWQEVKKDDNNCWEWQGTRCGGYGVFHSGGRMYLAHRLSFVAHGGKLIEDWFVCHKCDNRPCVNPDHLFLGTRWDNLVDQMIKGRTVKGSKHHKAKLTESKVLEIRQRLNSGESQTDIANDFGVYKGTISRIHLGQSWLHVNEINA